MQACACGVFDAFSTPSAAPCTAQVHELAAQLRQQHGLPGMRVGYKTKKGFYLLLGGGGGGGGGGRSGGGGRRKHPRDLEDSYQEEEEEAERGELQQTAIAGGQGRGAGRGQRQQQQQPGSGSVRVPPGFSVLQRSAKTVQVGS